MNMEDTVRATRVVFVGPDKEPMLLSETPEHGLALNDEEVLVKLQFATICSSDIHTISGRRLEKSPLVLGHEGVGEIVKDNRSEVHDGTCVSSRVTFSIAASCLECTNCRNGVPQKCDKLFKYGHANINEGTGFSGCYATHIILVPHTKIIPLPDKISHQIAATINCSLATSVHAVQVGRTGRRDEVALVQGAGLLGIYCCALLKEKGYAKVYCIDTDHLRLQTAAKFGAEILHASDNATLKDIENTVDCAIEVCGASAVVETGLRCLRFGGTYVFVGMVHPDTKLPITGENIVRKCVTIKGIHNYAPEHLTEAVQFLDKTWDKYPYSSLVNPKAFNLDHIENALEAASKNDYWRTGIYFD